MHHDVSARRAEAVGTRWGTNPFWNDLVERLERAEASTSFEAVRWDDDHGRWVADRATSESPPAFLQGRRLVVDVTDRTLTIYPLGLGGRFQVTPVVTLDDGSDTSAATQLIYGIGSAAWLGPRWRATFHVSTTLPVLEIGVAGADAARASIRAGGSEWRLDTPQWLELDDIDVDPVVARNNSSIPDPPPLDRPRAGICASRYGNRVVLAVAATAGEAEQAAATWESVREDQLGYWPAVASRLALTVPDEAITRQAAYSVHASLFSRSIDETGRDIFVHGRRDRGYADTAHLHQSYQMHLPALAAGEGASVRDELIAFLSLQDVSGWIERAPRPIAGTSRYVGRYTTANLLLAAERYLSWTGDTALFHEPVVSRADPVARTVADRIDRAAADLLEHRFRGLVQPCGWADAWNPQVRAQGQISAAAVLGLRAWAGVCSELGREQAARHWAGAAAEIAAAMRELLVDAATGLVAEHVFDDAITGGTPDDFWAHTQIWAALAGIVTDGRALDHVAATCLDHGVAIAPESAFEQEYVAASTDSAASLSLDSTATWLLARWPEVTHLYAMAELARGRAVAALGTVIGQLPETLHGLDPVCAPWFYAEKYLYPGTRPWLCTWAGDPSLIEVVLCGFLGIRPEPAGLRVAPSLPDGWTGGSGSARFVWRGRVVTAELSPTVPAGHMVVDGCPLPFGSLLRVDHVGDEHCLIQLSTQSIAKLPDNP